MRGSDLLDLPVVGPDGQPLGMVVDVRLVQDGPLLGAYAALRIEGLVVGRRRLASRLGYDRVDAQGPWLVGLIVRWLTRSTGYLPWAEVALDEGVVRSRRPELERVPPIT